MAGSIGGGPRTPRKTASAVCGVRRVRGGASRGRAGKGGGPASLRSERLLVRHRRLGPVVEDFRVLVPSRLDWRSRGIPRGGAGTRVNGAPRPPQEPEARSATRVPHPSVFHAELP